MASPTTGPHASAGIEPADRDERSAGNGTIAEREAHARHADVEREVQHRVRNVLAVVRSVLRRTVAVGGSGGHMIDHFSGRLDALARAHQAGAGRPDGRIDLEELIRGELHAFRFGDDPRIAISGPAVGIGPEIAQTLGLALHEMVTNSVKFGALSAAAPAGPGAGIAPGRVAIAWAFEGGRLRIDWIESDVPIVGAAPRRHGFGREFIEHAVPYQLGGTVRFDLVPGGLIYSLSLPLAASRTKKDERGWN